MRKGLLSIIVILLIIPLISAGELIILSDSFDYADAWSNHGWTYSNGGCGVAPEIGVPLESPVFGTNSFGINASPSVCAFTYFAKIEEDLVPENIGGLVVITYNFQITADSTKGNSVLEVQALTGNSTGNGIVFNHYEGGSNFTAEMSGAVTGTNCLHTDQIAEGEELLPLIANGRIEIDMGEGLYNWFINGEVGGCSGKSTDMSSFETIVIRRGVDSGNENQSSLVDDVQVIYSNSTLTPVVGSLPTGVPCEEDSDCSTGNCEYGVCSKKGGLENCNIDGDCISGSCLNGKCTKASVWAGIDASKDQLLGDDDSTNNFISLFFIFGLCALFIVKGGKRGVLPAVGIFFFGSIFFAIVGWLSPFIMIGNLLAGLVMFVVIMMLRGPSS